MKLQINISNLLRISLLLFLLNLLTSCGLHKPTVTYVTKDSIVTNTVVVTKDTIIKVPGDTIRFQVPCDKDTVFIYKSKSSTSLVTINKGKISVQNNCDEKDILISKLNAELTKYSSMNRDSSMVKTKVITKVPAIYKIFTFGFWVLLTVIGALFFLNKNIWFTLTTTVVGFFAKKKS